MRFRGPIGMFGCLLLVGLAFGCAAGRNSASASASGAPFSLSVTPASLEVPAGGSGYVVVTAARTGGFAGSIDLTVAGLPSGVTASGTIDAGHPTGYLTVAVAPGTAAGALGALQVQGSGGGLQQGATLTLTVLAPLPVATLPADAVLAAGGTQTGGGLVNQSVVLEPVEALPAQDSAGVVQLRHGFLPVPQPDLP